MARVTVNGNTQTFPDDTRLVRAIQALGIEIGHRCGGKARCTTCRVEFVRGEPDQMTQAEYDKLSEKGLLGRVRLSCQILCRQEMEVRPLMTKATEGWPDTGPEPAETIEPEPEWHKKQALLGGV